MLGKGASYEFRWRRWALLRDAVVAHLEDGKPGSRFPEFATIGDALGVDSVSIEATKLARELREIRAALGKLSVDDLVLGPPTASVLYRGTTLEAARPLTRTELLQIAPPGGAETLEQYFSTMFESMLHVCASPTEDGTIEILDG